ncbi:MAG: S8 family serine peptidase, partial [Chloroflexota bacterium]
MSAVQSTGRRAAARAIQLLAVALAATLLAPSLTTAQPILPGAVVALGRQSAVAVSHQVVVTWSAATVGATRAQRLATLGQPALTDRVSGAAGAQASYVRPFGLAGTSAVYRFAEPLGQGAGLTIDRIARMAGVVKVEPDPWMTIDTLPSDGNAGYVWGALGPSDTSVYGVATYGINAVASWATTTGSGVKVGVIDTGWVNHTDLAGQSLTGYDFISDTTQANDGDGRDADPSDAGDWVTAGEATASCTAHNSTWHGMHVSGTIAAIANNGYGTFGAAPNAKIVPIRALGKCGGSMSDIADALTWAYGGTVAGVPANANPVKVVNMSLGGTTSCPSYMQTAVTNARAAGTVVVVAAGNSGVDAGLSAPANCTGSLVVAATDIAGIRSVWSATGSSNYGSIVDIAAPGSSIASTWNSGTTTPVASPGGDTLGVMGGTSMATPHVAALAALLFEDYGTAQPAAIEYAITHGVTAFAADASAGHCTTSTCGAGIANAPAALAALVAADRTAPTATLTPPSSPTSATTLTYTAGFSESVTGLTAADLSVTGAGCVVGTPTGSGASWTVPVTGCAEGSVVLTLAASSVADSPVGNVGPASPVTATTVTVDRTAPVSAASIVAGYTTTTSVTVGYTVSDASVVSSITAWYSTAANLGSPSACGANGLPGASGNIACTIPAVDGTYYIYTIASDLAGNVEPAPVTPDDSIVRDATSPSVTVSGPATPTSAATLTFGLTFSESVSGLISADLTKGGAASGCIIGTPTGSGTTWSVDLTTCGEGTVSLVVNANSVVDVHGLTGPVSPS